MKLIEILTVTAATLIAMQTGSASAQTMDMKDPHAHPMAADSKTPPAVHKATGVVKKVDAAKGTVTLAHSAVPELKWPAMTMGFKVNDKTLLDKLAVDRKVEFEFIEQGKNYVVTAVK